MPKSPGQNINGFYEPKHFDSESCQAEILKQVRVRLQYKHLNVLNVIGKESVESDKTKEQIKKCKDRQSRRSGGQNSVS